MYSFEHSVPQDTFSYIYLMLLRPQTSFTVCVLNFCAALWCSLYCLFVTSCTFPHCLHCTTTCKSGYVKCFMNQVILTYKLPTIHIHVLWKGRNLKHTQSTSQNMHKYNQNWLTEVLLERNYVRKKMCEVTLWTKCTDKSAHDSSTHHTQKHCATLPQFGFCTWPSGCLTLTHLKAFTFRRSLF